MPKAEWSGSKDNGPFTSIYAGDATRVFALVLAADESFIFIGNIRL